MTSSRPQRRSIRLGGYDYTDQGPYFVTICTHTRSPLFGEITDMEMHLNATGQLVRDEWLRSESIRPGLILDAFVVMPNHIHGIVTFQNLPEPVGAHSRAPETQPNPVRTRRPRSLGSFIAGFKSATTKQINAHRGTPVWQRNYFEHIVRSDRSLDRIRNYIHTNPERWSTDPENPTSVHLR